MSLNPDPFEKIRNGEKTIEIRLYDDKRRTIALGDIITFSMLPEKTEKIRVEVIGLSIFKSFRDLFSNFDKSKFGHNNVPNIEEQISRLREHYTAEAERENGVIGIHIKLI
jgi:ASC-1-like (ASCH) protein